MPNVSVTITGHTSGIGLAISKCLSEAGYDVHGLSRSNGFNLKENYSKVLNRVLDLDSDYFINNVYVPDKQLELLKSVYNVWKFRKKLIVNICSVAALVPQDHPDFLTEYTTNKRDQRQFCMSNSFRYSKKDFMDINCSLVNINCDYVATNFKTKYDKTAFPNLHSQEVAAAVAYCVKSFESEVCIRELSMHAIRSPEISLGESGL